MDIQMTFAASILFELHEAIREHLAERTETGEVSFDIVPRLNRPAHDHGQWVTLSYLYNRAPGPLQDQDDYVRMSVHVDSVDGAIEVDFDNHQDGETRTWGLTTSDFVHDDTIVQTVIAHMQPAFFGHT